MTCGVYPKTRHSPSRYLRSVCTKVGQKSYSYSDHSIHHNRDGGVFDSSKDFQHVEYFHLYPYTGSRRTEALRTRLVARRVGRHDNGLDPTFRFLRLHKWPLTSYGSTLPHHFSPSVVVLPLHPGPPPSTTRSLFL